MSNYPASNYLTNKHNQLQAAKKDLMENMNPASPEDILAYKKMSIDMNFLMNTMKSEFEITHNAKKKILDGFQ